MAGTGNLKTKLRSVKSTCKFTSAMKTVSTAKYNAVSRIFSAFAPYADACRKAALLCPPDSVLPQTSRKLYIAITGNKSFCGDCNSEILKFIPTIVGSGDSLYLCGAWGEAHAADKGLIIAGRFSCSDIPTYTEAEAICNDLSALFESGEYESINFIHQKFGNILVHSPTVTRLLPFSSEQEVQPDTLLIPNADSVCTSVRMASLRALCYAVLLEAALCTQSSAMIAMRSASENADELYEKLLLLLNRKRQSSVTADVIETSARSKN